MTERILYTTKIFDDERSQVEGDPNYAEIQKKIPDDFYSEALFEILNFLGVELRYRMGTGSDSSVYKLTQQIEQIDPEHKLAVKIYQWDEKGLRSRKSKRGDCLALGVSEVPHAILPKAVITFNTRSDAMYLKLPGAEFDENERICASFFQAMHETEELYDVVVSRNGLGLDLTRYLGKQLLDALVILEEQNLMHRDIKLQNLLVSREWELYLIDWGYLRRLKKEDLTSSFCGSPEYAAPEILKHSPYNHKTDVYSFGVSFYAMLTGFFYLPFDTANLLKTTQKLSEFELSGLSFVEYSEQKRWWKWGDNPDLKDFFNRTITFDRESRPTFEELSRHPLFQNVKKPDIPFPALNTQKVNKSEYTISPPRQRKNRAVTQ